MDARDRGQEAESGVGAEVTPMQSGGGVGEDVEKNKTEFSLKAHAGGASA